MFFDHSAIKLEIINKKDCQSLYVWKLGSNISTKEGITMEIRKYSELNLWDAAKNHTQKEIYILKYMYFKNKMEKSMT